ncbi:unnamed protein product [Staurois parvus]|uniref:Uncharacterized protein n=1 Tax=Staurois parvus TaxID=386267 RepID=A0ABN9DUM8_9NEOB|nr:unnamed protein product [Staurois parvus]
MQTSGMDNSHVEAVPCVSAKDNSGSLHDASPSPRRTTELSVPLGVWVPPLWPEMFLHVPVVFCIPKSHYCCPVSGRTPWFLLVITTHSLGVGPLIKMCF